MKKITGFQNIKRTKIGFGVSAIIFLSILFLSNSSFAQGESRVAARISATQITVGDQARLFLEVQNNPNEGKLQWAAIPDSINNLEIVEKGKIDTVANGSFVTYRQRLIITGFDSGLFQVPSFVFSVIPNSGGAAYLLRSDSFQLLVQTVPVDTTKAFKPIKGIIFVNTTWLDYLAYFGIGALVLAILIAVIVYFARKRKAVVKPPPPKEPMHDRTLRLLAELEEKQLWQKNKVKEYYVELTDIVRSYIEERFNTPSMELTTDELLTKVQFTKELQPYYTILSVILHTADLAKFAKAQPLPQEHTDAMEHARQFVKTSKPIIIQITNETETKI